MWPPRPTPAQGRSYTKVADTLNPKSAATTGSGGRFGLRPFRGANRMGSPRRARLFEVVAETSNGEFSWHENTTLLLPFSGAVDAGAEAPITVCQVCPISPAGCSRRWQGATRAGRAASTLTRGSGRNDYRIQYGENSRELSAKMRWAALHGGRCGGWCWCSSRNGFKVRRQI